MRIGIFSDMHLGPYGDRVLPSSGLNMRMMDYHYTLSHIMQDMRKRKVDVCLFGGDAFKDKSGKPNPTQLKMFGSNIFPSGEQFFDIHMIPGNHDLPRAMGEADALACFEWLGGIHIHRTPELFNWCFNDKVQIITLPYPNRNALMTMDSFKDMPVSEVNNAIGRMLAEKLKELASRLDPNIPSVLIAHLALDVAKAGSENQMMMGRDICLSMHEIPDNIDYCFFGHIHKPQEIQRHGFAEGDAKGKVYIIGSPESVDFGEEGDVKRWLLLDTDAGTVESIPTNSRRYFTFDIDYTESTYDDICTLLAYQGSTGMRDGDIVRARIKMRKNQQFPLAEFKQKLLNNGAFSVKIEREYIPEERDIQAVQTAEAQTQEDIFRQYCESKNITGSRADRLVEAGLSVMAEMTGE